MWHGEYPSTDDCRLYQPRNIISLPVTYSYSPG